MVEITPERIKQMREFSNEYGVNGVYTVTLYCLRQGELAALFGLVGRLREAEERAEALRRLQVGSRCCRVCQTAWKNHQPERHADGCIARPKDGLDV